MCECGCTLNDDHYILPARSGLVYLITLSGACENCDAPSGITIERFNGQKDLREKRCFGEELPPQLPFEKWADSDGVAIITGHRRHEFVKATMNGLIGLKPDDFCHTKAEKKKGFDKIAAETILEDLYASSTVRPFVVEAKK